MKDDDPAQAGFFLPSATGPDDAAARRPQGVEAYTGFRAASARPRRSLTCGHREPQHLRPSSQCSQVPTRWPSRNQGFRASPTQDGAFELREYAAYLVAETRVEASFGDAGNVAFQRLFRYISGNNVEQAEDRDDRTGDPVARGREVSMTAPVSQTAAGTGFLVAFTLPSTFTLETAPKPLEPAIGPQGARAPLMACWRYSGRWTESQLPVTPSAGCAMQSRRADWFRAASQFSRATTRRSRRGSCAATRS